MRLPWPPSSPVNWPRAAPCLFRGSVDRMGDRLRRAYLLWLREKRDIVPEQFTDEAEERVGRVLDEAELKSVVLDLIDEELVEASMGGALGIEESDLPLRVRLTHVGQRVVRKFDGDVDAWRAAEDAAVTPGMGINVAGNVMGSQLGVGGRDVMQTQRTDGGGLTQQFIDVLERMREHLEEFDLGEDDRNELDDLSADAIRAAQDSSATPDADDDRQLTTGAKRRGYKVRAILEKVSTAAAGGLIAHESAAVLGQLLG